VEQIEGEEILNDGCSEINNALASRMEQKVERLLGIFEM
jgi:hypothetical protein